MRLARPLALATAVAVSSRPSSAQSSTCSPGGFELKLRNACDYESLRAAYEEFVNDPLLSSDCGVDVQAELSTLLNAAPAADLNGTVRAMCLAASEETVRIPSMSSLDGSDEWLEEFYDGGTDWNEEVETSQNRGTLYEPHGSLDNKLKSDARNVKTAYEYAEHYRMEYPSHLSNFDLAESCKMNSVMCCWVADRQAGDGNGNCNTPYDTKCIDKDPADNTDLCFVHHDRHMSGLGGDGFSFFEQDNDNGEGRIHCHGFAWSNDELDVESRYRGNNLFYVSMYDHLHNRGYVRNVPGAPMCGCVDQMPIVARADCTQTDVDEVFKFKYDPVARRFSVSVEDISVDFNACQGANNQDNDLSAYVARLAEEGKMTERQKNAFGEHLVGNGRCPFTIERNLAAKGIVRGIPELAYETYDFPEVDTDEFVHAFCVTGATDASAAALDFDLTYEAIADFADGQQIWSDRGGYVFRGVDEGPCAGGIYLKPSRHKSIDRFTDVTVGAVPVDAAVGARVCVMFRYKDERHGRWPEQIMTDGFNKITSSLLNLDSEFRMIINGEAYAINTYCKTLPAEATTTPGSPPPAIPSDAIEAEGDAYVRNGSYKHINYGPDLELRVKNDSSDSYDRKGLIEFDLSRLSPIRDDDSVSLRLYVAFCDTDTNRLITVSRLADVDGTIDTDAITWNTLDQTTAKVGNRLSVDYVDEGSWVEVTVTDLVRAVPGNDKLVLFLENLSGSRSKGLVGFGTKESGYAPRLVKYDSAAASSTAIVSTEDAYVRGGTYDEVRHGILPILRVKESSGSSYDRKSLIEFDLRNVNVLGDTTGILQLFVRNMGVVDVFHVAVSRLDDKDLDFDEGTVTWENLDPVKAKNGNRVRITPNEVGSWVEVSVSTLLRSLDGGAGTTNKVVLFLESRDGSGGEHYVDFESSEGTYAPRLLLDGFEYLPTDDPSPSPSAAPSVTAVPTNDEDVRFDVVADGYVRNGIYTDSNFGSDDGLMVKNDSSSDKDRKAIIEFHLGRHRFGEMDSGTLRLFVQSVCSDSSRTITVSRLIDNDWQEDATTWSNLNPTVAKQGPSFSVTTAQAQSWIEIDVTSIATEHTSNKLVFYLENLGSAGSSNCVTFASREAEGYLGAQLIRSTLNAVALLETTADSYVQDGTNKATNFGLEPILFVKQDSNSNYDRRAILNFDLGGIAFTKASEAVLRLFVSHVGDASSRTITVVRLEDNAWVEEEVTWDNLNGIPVSGGVVPPTFTVEKANADTWVQVPVTDLVNALPASDTLTLMLENRGSAHSSGHCTFQSREGDHPPQLIIL